MYGHKKVNSEDMIANVSVGSIKNLLMKMSVVVGTVATPTNLCALHMVIHPASSMMNSCERRTRLADADGRVCRLCQCYDQN